MFASWRVAVVFTAANLTGGAFRGIVNSAGQAEKAVAGNEAAMKRMRAAAIGAFATVGVVGVAAFLHASDAAAKYQMQMVLLQQQLGATDDQMNKIGRTIVNLSSGGNRTMLSAGDLSVMARGIQQSGLNALQVNSLLTPIAYAAEIQKQRNNGSLDPGHFAGNLGATIKGYHLGDPGKEKQAYDFADLYTRYASISKLNDSGLLAYENQFGMIARQNKWSVDDFMSAGAYFSQMGIKPQMVGTMMKNIVTNQVPRTNLNSHTANAQFQGLMLQGMLNPADPAIAKKYLSFVQQSEKAIGMPGADPSKMTPAAQEGFAQMIMRASITSKAYGTGLSGLAKLAQNAKKNFEKWFGKDQGDSMFSNAARTVFNLRGAPAWIALADGGPKSVADLHKAAMSQTPLSERARVNRNLQAGQQATLPAQLGTLMIELGGMTNTKKAPAGSPLDIMQKVTHQLIELLSVVTDWGAQNLKLIGQIGTLIGILGVAGLAGSLALVLSALAPVFATLGTFAAFLSGTMLFAVAAPLAGFVAIGAAIFLFATHLGDIQHYLGKIGSWIHDVGGPALGRAIAGRVECGDLPHHPSYC